MNIVFQWQARERVIHILSFSSFKRQMKRKWRRENTVHSFERHLQQRGSVFLLFREKGSDREDLWKTVSSNSLHPFFSFFFLFSSFHSMHFEWDWTSLWSNKYSFYVLISAAVVAKTDLCVIRGVTHNTSHELHEYQMCVQCGIVLTHNQQSC